MIVFAGGLKDKFQSTQSSQAVTGEGTNAVRISCISIHTALAGCDGSTPLHCFICNISIHTALAGCDGKSGSGKSASMRFQSTQPSQAVTNDPCTYGGRKSISIHTALAGCDFVCQNLRKGVQISIHTALAGCDHNQSYLKTSKSIFQSTQPSQAVTADWFYLLYKDYDFNPHSPRRL